MQVSSDISKPTYEKNGSKRTIDYIFPNSKPSVINTKTINYLNSDQYALSIKIQIPPIIYITEHTLTSEKTTKHRYDECRENLKDISVDDCEMDNIILKFVPKRFKEALEPLNARSLRTYFPI